MYNSFTAMDQNVKRTRKDEEEAGPSNRGNNHVCNVENLVFEVIQFLSVEENYDLQKIEHDLLPRLLAQSTKFNGGNVADFSKIQDATDFQLQFLYRLFKYASVMKIHSLYRGELVLSYLLNFKYLNKLQVTISENENFSIIGINLPISALKIITKTS